MRCFFEKTIRAIDINAIQNSGMNDLCYIFRDAFNEIKIAMGWVNPKYPNRARIHNDRALMIIDLRNIFCHPLDDFIIDDNFEYFMLLNIYLFIKALESKFDDDESRKIFTECEDEINKYLKSEPEGSAEIKTTSQKKDNVSNNNTEIKNIVNHFSQQMLSYHNTSVENFSTIKSLLKDFLLILNNMTKLQNLNNQIINNTINVQERVVEETEVNPPPDNNDDIDWFNSIEARQWFEFSSIAADNRLFTPKARAFLFNLGRIRTNGWNITTRQLSWARDLYGRMNEFLKR